MFNLKLNLKLLLAGPVLAGKPVTQANSVQIAVGLSLNPNQLLALGNDLAELKILASSVRTAVILNRLLKKVGPVPAAV